jgi:hypothetical protein
LRSLSKRSGADEALQALPGFEHRGFDPTTNEDREPMLTAF